MSSLVVDTHAAVWYLLKSPRLSRTAYAAIDEATQADANIYLSAISLVEVIYLAEKGRLSQDAVEGLLTTVSSPETGWILASLDLGVAQALARISREETSTCNPGRKTARQQSHNDLVTLDLRLWYQ